MDTWAVGRSRTHRLRAVRTAGLLADGLRLSAAAAACGGVAHDGASLDAQRRRGPLALRRPGRRGIPTARDDAFRDAPRAAAARRGRHRRSRGLSHVGPSFVSFVACRSHVGPCSRPGRIAAAALAHEGRVRRAAAVAAVIAARVVRIRVVAARVIAARVIAARVVAARVVAARVVAARVDGSRSRFTLAS